MAEYKDLIEKLQDINNKEFNIFKILKVDNYEIRHSSFLRWLLDVKASHGLGTQFAEKFFEECFGKNHHLDPQKIETVQTEVRTNSKKMKEKGKDKRRIDILILGKDFVCLIENKFGSKESIDQLGDYKSYVDEKYKDKSKKKYIFLDIKEKEDEDDNGYVQVSYKQIKDILNDLDYTGIDPSVKSVITQYKKVLEEIYELDDDIKNEISSLSPDLIIETVEISDKGYKEKTEDEKMAIDVIKKYYRDVKDKNDELILKIIKKISYDKLIKKNYGSGKKRNDGSLIYAYAISIPDKVFPDESFINTIDYRAIGRLDIAIYAGLSGTRSRALLKYIESNGDFWDSLFNLNKEGWQVAIEYRIGKANNYLNKKNVHKIEWKYQEKEKTFFKNINKEYNFDFDSCVTYRNPKGEDNVKEQINLVKGCLEFLKDKEIPEKVNDVKIDDKNSYKEIIEEIENEIDKYTVGICSCWCISLIYPLKIDSIKDDNKKDVENIYREKTIQGLEVFGLDEKFKAMCLNPFEV